MGAAGMFFSADRGASGQVFQSVDHYDTVRIYSLHDDLHDILRKSHTASGIRLDRSEAVQEDGRASSGSSVFIEADVKAVPVLIVVIHDVFAVVHLQVREILDVNHLVVMHAFARISGPVGVLIHLYIGDRTAGIISNAVKRTAFEGSQTSKGFWGRKENVEKAFQLVNGKDIKNKHLLIIDDVVTTGATVMACSKELTKAGGVKVSVLALCFAKS